MQTIYFANNSIKEKILSDMINLVKVFSVVVVVLSIVLITVQVCETAKRDFKLRNIFRFMDDKKVNKKAKKDIKHLKDFKVHYIDGKNQEKMVPSESRPPNIHTLMPLPLPVHLPIPTHPIEHSAEHGRLPPPPLPPHPQQALPVMHPDHLPFHHETHFHHHNPYDHVHHHHHHDVHHHEPHYQISGSSPQFMSASNPVLRPPPPPLIFHQDMNRFALAEPSHIEERISYPVFEFIGDLEDTPSAERKKRVQPNAHSYRDIDDKFGTNLSNNRKNRMNDNKVLKEHKSIQTTVRLVNNKKFNTIHNTNTNYDKFFDEETIDSRKFVKSKENHNNSDERQNQRQDSRKSLKDLSPSDNRRDEKIYSESVPDEQLINVVEDEWTFKDLDLWIIR